MGFKPIKLYRAFQRTYGLLPYHLFGNGYAFLPLRVAFLVTYRCNLRCGMCPISCSLQEDLARDELSTVSIKEIIRKIPRFSFITLTGGEPFIRKDIIEITEYIADRNRCTIITNGTLLGEDMIRALVKMSPRHASGKGLFLIGFSIQGIGAVHDRMVRSQGAFDRVIKAIQSVQQEKRRQKKGYPLVEIKTVINDSNIGMLSELLTLAEKLKVDIYSFQLLNTQSSVFGLNPNLKRAFLESPPPVNFSDVESLKMQLDKVEVASRKTRMEVRFNPSIPSSEVLKRYENRLDLSRYICYAPWFELHINPYGEVYPCYSYPRGDLKDRSLKSILNSAEFKEFRKRLKKEKIFAGCLGCPLMEYKGKN